MKVKKTGKSIGHSYNVKENTTKVTIFFDGYVDIDMSEEITIEVEEKQFLITESQLEHAYFNQFNPKNELNNGCNTFELFHALNGIKKELGIVND